VLVFDREVGMRALLGSAALISLCFLPCRFALAEEASCSTDEDLGDGFTRSVELKLKLDHEHPAEISFETVFGSGQEGGAYSCRFSASAVDHKSVWTAEKDKVVVRVPRGDGEDQDPEKESLLEISRTKDGFLVTFVDMSRWNCGFGAAYPKSVRLVTGKKKCVSVFDL
jgi:hypothetical protein